MKVSATMLDTFRACETKFYWRYIRHLVPVVVAIALRFGIAIHAAMDVRWNGGTVDEAIAAFRKEFPADIPGDDKRTLRAGAMMIRAYYESYANDDQIIHKVESTERRDEFELGNFKVRFKLDKTIRLKACPDILYIVDHKTTSKLDGLSACRLKPNNQFDTYLYGAAQVLDTPASIGGLMVDYLEVPYPYKNVPKDRPKVTGPPYLYPAFARPVTTRMPVELLHWANRTLALLNKLEQKMESTDPWAWDRRTAECVAWKAECPYRGLCLQPVALSEVTIPPDRYKIHDHSADPSTEDQA